MFSLQNVENVFYLNFYLIRYLTLITESHMFNITDNGKWGFLTQRKDLRIFQSFLPENLLKAFWKYLMRSLWIPPCHQNMEKRLVFDLILQQIFWAGETSEIVSIVRRNWKWFIKIFSFNKTFVLFLSCWKSPLEMKLITLNKHYRTTICYKSIVRQINFLTNFSNLFSQYSA